MARVQTMVQLTDELVKLLDEEAAERGISRSAVIRDAVETVVAQRRDDEIGRQIAEGYRRIPQDTPDEWGSLVDQADRATRDTMRHLEAEERAAGFEPW